MNIYSNEATETKITKVEDIYIGKCYVVYVMLCSVEYFVTSFTGHVCSDEYRIYLH